MKLNLGKRKLTSKEKEKNEITRILTRCLARKKNGNGLKNKSSWGELKDRGQKTFVVLKTFVP